MSLRDRMRNSLGRLFRLFSRLGKGLACRWRSLTPGFRYALVYFLCVVCIASLVWWQFNPANSLVFDPNGKPDSDGQAPHLPEAPPQGEDDENQEAAVFSPERGDKLILPLKGEILAFPGDPFALFPGYYLGNIAGLHIDGTAGDEVCAAWQGVVEEVAFPDTYDPGEVTIKHGQWTTVYKNLDNILVEPGQVVEAGQKLGELAAKLYGTYSGDYLEFQLLGPDQEVWDPCQYTSVDR
jgi:murein DD-endopeptidase MepM/ murein hydrolase activator NlpD